MPRLPEVKYPKKLEDKLYGLIWDLFKPWYQDLVTKALAEKSRIDHTDSDELHTDGLFDTVFDAARTDWEAKAKAKAADFHNLGLSVDLHARMGLQGQVDAAAAFDPDKTKTVPGITPPKLAELDDFVSENVRLVRSIGDDAANRLQRLVIDAHKNGTPTSELAKAIKDELEYADNRAHLIAADQLGKINSDMTRLNHEAIGVVGYFWSTSGAPNVRPARQVRNGVYFAYADPPADGHAGKPIRCRCTQHPDIFGEGPSQAKPAAEPPPKPKASASKKQPTQGSTTPPAAAPPSGGSAPPDGGNGGGKKPPKKPKAKQPAPGPGKFNLSNEMRKLAQMRALVDKARFSALDPLKNFSLDDFKELLNTSHKLEAHNFQSLLDNILVQAEQLIEKGDASSLKDYRSQVGNIKGALFELEGAYKVNDIMDLRAVNVRAKKQPGDIDLLAVHKGEVLLIELKNGAVRKGDITRRTIPFYKQIYHQEGKWHVEPKDRKKPLKLVIIAQNAMNLDDVLKAQLTAKIEEFYDSGLILNDIDDLKA